MNWWGINLASRHDSDGGFATIADEFASAFLGAGAPGDAAVFAGGLSSIGQTLYFSPGAYAIAGELIDRFGGVPVPCPEQARLLIGGEGADTLGVKIPMDGAAP